MTDQNIKDYIKRYQKAHNENYPKCLSCGCDITDANYAAAWYKGRMNFLCPECWEDEINGRAY